VKKDWEMHHAQRWSHGNHRVMGLTPRVTKQSLEELNAPRAEWTTEEVADAIIIAFCVAASVTLLAIGLFNRFGGM